MENLIYILFICITIPIIMLIPLLGKRSRQIVSFMLIGCFVCLFASELNGAVRNLLFDKSLLYITTSVTPVIEECCKAVPILFYAYIFTDDQGTILEISMATGIGFAILENAYIMLQIIDNATIPWALVRGFGSGLMHGICTLAVGYGISFIKKRKKLFLTGTFALLSSSIIYHSIYNCFVQSKYKYIGFILPLFTYIIVFVKLRKSLTHINFHNTAE